MATAVSTKTAGGSFLIEDQSPDDIFTPEDLPSSITTLPAPREFFDNEVRPHVEAMQHGDFDNGGLTLRKACGPGALESILTPERYGEHGNGSHPSAMCCRRAVRA